MSLNISSGKRPLPPRIFLYGSGGIGKTTFAASIPGAVLLPVEEGSDSIDCQRLPQPKTFEECLEAIASLWENDHSFTTLAIDSVTALEQLLWQSVCASHAWKSIEAPGFGKGYVAAGESWRKLLDGLSYLRAKKGMQIVLIGHAEIKSIASPDSEAFDRYQPRLHKVPCAMLTEWSDALLFAQYEKAIVTDEKTGKTRGIGSGERILQCTERPSHLAKNRYRMTDTLPMTYAAVSAAITAAFKE